MKILLKLPIKKKAVLAIAALYTIAALLDGHWLFAIAISSVAYWYAIKPNKPKTFLQQPINPVNPVNNDVDDAYDEKPRPEAFNQMSSSGNTIWTDYDEHIHK